MPLNRRHLVAAALAAACVPAAMAQAWPAKAIKVIVPFPPGGGTDIIAREVTQKVSAATGWTFVIDNRPGAGGNLGVDTAAKSPADGYTLVLGQTSNLAINPTLYAKLPYNPLKDLAPITMVATAPLAIVVAADSPHKTLADLVNAAKAKPGEVNFASPGNGTVAHLAGELFQKAAGIKFTHVPYKGSAPANTDLAGGHVDLHIDQLSSVLPLLQGGKLRALAVTTAKRSPLLPEVPTLAESGVTGFDASTTLGLVMPAGVAPEVAAQINTLLNDTLRQPAVQEQFAKLGAQPRPGTREEYAEFIRSEVARTARIVRQAGITLD
jgi:tripartite-type tricarboxylate transporter receptor subunit TctC